MSEPDAITTLAMKVEELVREAEEARQDAAAAKSAVARWNARLEVEGIGPTLSLRRDIKNLNERANGLDAKVDALAATVGAAMDQGKLKVPSGPRWDGLDQDQEAAQLGQLREWVNGVLLVQYPEYTFPGCWESHRVALWELGGLWAEWRRVFGDPCGVNLESMLWFHERWLPNTLGRLSKAISPDGAMGCRAHGYGDRWSRGA
jgi:outer membrane murein-binding lipoprotein Lpp